MMTPQTYEHFRRELGYRFWLSGAVKLGNFTLKSGEKSNWYVDCKQMTMHGPTLGIICRLMNSLIEEAGWKADSVGGMELGAVPLVSGFLVHNAMGIQHGFVVRKETKKHGLDSRVIGYPTGKCILIEDVVTTGGTIIDAIEALGGIQPIGVICIVNRREFGNKYFIEYKSVGYPVRSIFTLEDLYNAKPGEQDK